MTAAATGAEVLGVAEETAGAAARLAGNLAALRKSDAALARRLEGAGPAGRYLAARATGGGEDAPTGLVDAAMQVPVGSAWPPVAAEDPACGEGLLGDAGGPAANRPAVACLGAGDGHGLAKLAAEPANELGMERAVYAVEPDLTLLRAVLCLHDWSGPGSPLTDRRFAWAAGPAWASLAAAARRRPMWPEAGRAWTLDRRQGPALLEAWKKIEAAETRHEAALRAQLAAGAAAVGPADAAAALRRRGGEDATRVLVVTSRFTTVLRHAAAELAAAAESIGCRSLLLMEAAAHERAAGPAVGEAVRRFRPDVVLTLDHLRESFAGWLPPGLPLVSWLQDDLPHLLRPAAGASVASDARQLVLSHDPQKYVRGFGYPPARTLVQGKLARAAADAASATDAPHADLCFVSNAGFPPEELIDRAASGERGDRATLLRASAEKLVAAAAEGCAFDAQGALGPLLDAAAEEAGLAVPADEREGLLSALFISVWSPLYRQEAVGWAVDAAETAGWRVALHGLGWERHPRFAAHARGTLAYGFELDAATAGSAINLQVVPYSCLHQRLLDGVAAGGFFLVREHPFDRWCLDLDRLTDHLPPDAADDADARSSGEEAATLLAGLHARAATLMVEPPADLVADRRRLQAGDRLAEHAMLPGHAGVAFTDRAGCRDLLHRWMADPGGRAALVARQREAVLARRGYPAMVGRVLGDFASILEAPA